ncbi:MAG: hypothetical protein EBR55_05470, partial [Chitinophagia bacterium]|nr:hypothetical protein [Chitinophagia bacterium]
MAIIILTIVYLLSGIGAYFLIRKNYSKGGVWQNIEPNLADLMLVITPIANTMICIGFGIYAILDKILISNN